MAKKTPIKKESPKKGKKQKPKKKPVKVYYPVITQRPEDPEPKEEICEAELSYNNAIFCTKIERLAAKGLNNEEIIKSLGIHRTTFYDKIKSDPYFSYALMKHRNLAIHEVENALFKSCTGFEYTEEQGSPSGIIMEVKKRALPNANSIKFFLSNRRPDEWKMKVEASMEIKADMSLMTFSIKRRSE